jgi:pullulanase
MNGWGTSDELTYDGLGHYSTTLALGIASFQFKFANGAFSNEFAFGTTTDAGSLVLTDSGGNLTLNAAAAGNYLFTLDAINSIISVTLVP